MRLIVQPFGSGFELCARLGLVFVAGERLDGRIVHAVLGRSPSAQAGIEARDIIFAVGKTPWETVRRLTFSDRRPSEITLRVFVARYFAVTGVTVRVPPQPYQPLDDIAAEAAAIIAARPMPDTRPYQNPRFDEVRELLARFSRRRRRR
jgi:hypothetical protein